MSARLRLRKLEDAQAAKALPAGRVFTIFRESDAQVERETERLRREKGLCDNDQLIVIGWWGNDKPIGHAA